MYQFNLNCNSEAFASELLDLEFLVIDRLTNHKQVSVWTLSQWSPVSKVLTLVCFWKSYWTAKILDFFLKKNSFILHKKRNNDYIITLWFHLVGSMVQCIALLDVKRNTTVWVQFPVLVVIHCAPRLSLADNTRSSL